MSKAGCGPPRGSVASRLLCAPGGGGGGGDVGPRRNERKGKLHMFRRASKASTAKSSQYETDSMLDDEEDEGGDSDVDLVDLAVRDDDDQEEGRGAGGRPAPMVRGESQEMKLLRSQTLEKYARVVGDGSGGGAKGGAGKGQFGDLHQQRSDRTKLEASQASDPKLVETRRARAQTLKGNFFHKVMEDGSMNLMQALEEEQQRRASKRMSKRASKRAAAAGGEQGGEEGFDYALMEEALEGLRNQQQLLEESERILLDQHCAELKQRSRGMLSEQTRSMREARVQGKKISKQLRKHIAKVNASLKQMLREDFSGGASKLEDHEGSKGGGGLFGFGGGKDKGKKKGHKKDTSGEGQSHSPEQRATEQRQYEADVTRLRKELGALQRIQNKLRLEERFPQGMQWKIKVDAGDGTFIGVRDLEVGEILADFSMFSSGSEAGGHVTLRVTNICASVGILDLSIRGANAKAKILGGLLTPTINRLDLDIKGSWTLELRFVDAVSGFRLGSLASSAAQEDHARWEEVNSDFQLDISRKVSGLSAVRLPKPIVQALSRALIPKLISGALRSVLPPQLGVLLSQQETRTNSAKLSGRLEVRGDMRPSVWREPLVGPTPAAAEARAALGISEEEAVALDFLCRGQRSRVAGFKDKAISLARLFKWRLKYATISVDDLGTGLLNTVQKDSAAGVALPDGWLTEIVRTITVLARKPVNVALQVDGLDVDADLPLAVAAGLDVYVSSFQAAANMARGSKLRATTKKQLREAEMHAIAVNKIVNDYVVGLVNPSARLVANGVLVGGIDTGLVAVALERAAINAKLPQHFSLTTLVPKQTQDQLLQFDGCAGPREDEYTLKITDKTNDKAKRVGPTPDSEISLRNTKLELFPANTPQGTVKLEAAEVRASVQLSTLDRMLGDLSSNVSEKQLGKQRDSAQNPGCVHGAGGFLFADSRALIKRGDEVIGLFRAHDVDQGVDEVAPRQQQRGKPTRPAPLLTSHQALVLPKLLSQDSYNLTLDVKGVNVDTNKVPGTAAHPESLRVAVKTDERDASTCLVFQCRFNLRQFLDEAMAT